MKSRLQSTAFLFALSLLMTAPLKAASAQAVQAGVQIVQKGAMKPVAHNIIQVLPEGIVCARDLSDVQVFHIRNSFFALREGVLTKIHPYNVDQELRNLSEEDVKKFLENGCLQLTQSSNGDYNLKAQSRVLGGGANGALFGYWACKTVCWAFVGTAATVGTGVVITAAAPAVGGALGLSAAQTATGTIMAKSVASSAMGKAGLTGVTAKALAAGAAYSTTGATTVAAATAVEGVTAYAGAAGGLAGLAASIEGISIAFGGLFGVLSGPV